MQWLSDLDLILSSVKRFGPWTVLVIVIVLFIRILMDEDRTDIWRARVYKALFKITGKTAQEKSYISKDIRGRLNLARRKMHFGQAVIPRAIDVVWVESGNGETAEVKEGQFVIKLNPSESQERNISTMACALVRRTTLLGIRHLVGQHLQTAIDFNLAKRLIENTGKRAIYDWFVTNEYVPTIESSEESKKESIRITTIDERGLFTRMLLVELNELAQRVYGLEPKPYMASEVMSLVEFLYKICSREHGEEIPLRLVKPHIQTSVILVAKTSKILSTIQPYVENMMLSIQKSISSVYVIVFDKEWLGEQDRELHGKFQKQVDALVSEYKRMPLVELDFDVKYTCRLADGGSRSARCIRYRIQNGNRMGNRNETAA
jgi:hypothetical protein